MDAVDAEGYTALMWASHCDFFSSKKDNLDSIRYLLEIEADVNHCSSKSGTAMHRAAYGGHTEILKVILRQ